MVIAELVATRRRVAVCGLGLTTRFGPTIPTSRYRPLALDGVYERRPKRPAAFSLPDPTLRFGRLIALRGKTTEDRNLLTLLDPVAEAAGFEIVRLRLMGGTSARRLQIMAERGDGSMVVEDCAALARALNPVLDAADPIAGEYSLEVSSPGVDRPLTRLKDFAAYEGFEARLEIDRMAEGRKRFRGELAGVEDGHVAINLEGEAETALLPFEWLVDAKLVITDALLQRGADERAARMDTTGVDIVDPDIDSDAPPASAPPKKVRDLKPKPKAKAKPKPVANPNRARGPGGSDPDEDQKD
jgi:ribosome maturation factor RimP